MKKQHIPLNALIVFILITLLGCQLNNKTVNQVIKGGQAYADSTFWQEYHEAFPVSTNSPKSNEVRSIVADFNNNIWIATADGIFVKKANESVWTTPFSEADQGPSFSVIAGDSATVWLSNWKGLYTYKNGELKLLTGITPPISTLCSSEEGVYALGPNGVWLFDEKGSHKKDYPIGRSVRGAISDKKGGLWVGSDVGIHHATPSGTKHIFSTDHLISAYIKGFVLDENERLWTAGLGGVSILKQETKDRFLKPADGIPSIYVNCIEREEDGTVWIGTQGGVVRYPQNGQHSLLFSRRWLLDDQVNDIAFDQEGTAWVATQKGVSAIRKKKMNLVQKEAFFYDVLMKRHIRAPWTAGHCRLRVPGDITTWEPEDDDNDGEFTGNYLAMESFRYATTKDPDAKEKAKKAFNFLKLLQEVTETDGFFARAVIPVDWKEMHDPNLTYTERELADELVKEPRFKPVEERWRKSKDGKWLWKGDTSSDEMCGHMMGYYFYYTLVADDAEKAIISRHVAKIVDHLIRNNYNLVDIDGKPTRWSIWSPDALNRDPEWSPDKPQNSMEVLGFLKLAYHMTSDEKYEKEYIRLINEEHYHENMAQIGNQNPAWFIYFDVVLQAYIYPMLIKCEKDPEKRAFYEKHMDEWFERRRGDENPLLNFFYCYTRDKKTELNASVGFLRDTPLDLIDWTIDHTKREDIKLVRTPVLDDLQTSELPNARIRATVRWDKNPWGAALGYPNTEREPVFWLFPYWMGRYLTMIQ
jgi:hypothetical protein